MTRPHRATIIPTPFEDDATEESVVPAPSRGESPPVVRRVAGSESPHSPAPRLTVLPRLGDRRGGGRLLFTPESRYEILHSIGSGAAGEVWLAEDRDIGRRVAIKKATLSGVSEAVLRRFIDEIKTVGRLEHPNIVPIHDVGQDEAGEFYFVMKYVEGVTLAGVIDRLRDGDPAAHARFGVEQRVQIVRGLIDAVAFAHDKGVVHRDLKPENVMVGPFGEVMVLDWGIAASESVTRREQALIGTPQYMSPEQASRRPVDRRSDIYSLSVVLHELLTLRHYLEDVDGLDALLEGVRSRPVPLASTVRHPHQDALPMDLSWLVDKGVRKDPAERYQDVRDMLDVLRDRAEGNVHVQCPVTFAKRASSEVEKAMDRYVVPSMGSMLSAGRPGILLAGAFMAAMIGMMVLAAVAFVALLTVVVLSYAGHLPG